MSEPGTAWSTTAGARPNAYDPVLNPELFEGVLARRIVAFFIDLFVVGVPVVLMAMFILVFGVITLGLGWFLFWLLSPGAVIWTLIYYGMTLGSPHSATIGMRVVGLQMRTWYGSPAYFVLGAVHVVLYWVTVSVLTPFILLVGVVNERRRLLHDLLLGVVIINNPGRFGSAPTTGLRPGV
jgi:uncharacterized RDD family membrane protein YckC